MKIRLILILFAFFINAVSIKAQTTKAFSTNDIFSIQNKSFTFVPTYQMFQSRGELFNVLNNTDALGQSKTLSNNVLGNCDDSNVVFAPDAAPCNGVSVTSISFLNNANRVKESTTIADNTVNVVYRYKNVGIAPDGTVLDALVKVVHYTNTRDNQ